MDVVVFINCVDYQDFTSSVKNVLIHIGGILLFFLSSILFFFFVTLFLFCFVLFCFVFTSFLIVSRSHHGAPKCSHASREPLRGHFSLQNGTRISYGGLQQGC